MKLKNLAIIALIALGCAFIYVHHRSSVKSQQIEVYEHNIRVLNDSLRTVKLQNGQLLVERGSLILSEAEMSKQLGLKKDEISDLKSKLSSAITQLNKVQAVVIHDSIYIPGKIIYATADSLKADFVYKDDWTGMSGTFNYKNESCSVQLYDMCTNIPLTIGLTESKHFFVTSTNPHVQFTDINSTINIKSLQKPKRWSLGLNVGPGFFYDITRNQIGAGIGCQIGVNYNF